MDLAIAVPLLLLSSPILLITALLIRLESPGPVIYRQERVGLDGRSFTILKFRSMRADAERAGPTWAAKSDSRVTRIGGFIRKVRIDELPQLMNILRGDMSVVGPRPERPHFVAQLSREIPVFAERARVKPGLTGWAQINYPYGSSIEDARNKLSFDLYYIKHRSLLFNLVILFATIRVILFQEGAR
jgi:exopolysaccharide biosynthesis polyprenyl glycosylphosphotransferase